MYVSNMPSSFEDKLQEFLEQKIQYAKDFDLQFFTDEILNRNRRRVVYMVVPRGWNHRVYRLVVEYFVSEFRDPSEYFISMNEVEVFSL